MGEEGFEYEEPGADCCHRREERGGVDVPRRSGAGEREQLPPPHKDEKSEKPKDLDEPLDHPDHRYLLVHAEFLLPAQGDRRVVSETCVPVIWHVVRPSGRRLDEILRLPACRRERSG